MKFKRLFKSKTFWTGLATLGFGIYRVIQGEVDGAETILLGIGMIFGRDAIAKLEDK
jgi:hypothetical protein